MDRYTVTNADFRRFIDATRYVTLAERPPDPADYPGAPPECSNLGRGLPHDRGPGRPARPHTWWTYGRRPSGGTPGTG